MAAAVPMTRLHLSLLGGFDLVGAAADAPPLTRKARAIIAYLALQSGYSQSREKLASLLWGGSSESQARMSLRQALSAIRKIAPAANGEWLRADCDGITLNLAHVDFDVARLESLAAGSTPEELGQAIALYRGDLLDGFSLKEEAFENWLRAERERLRMLAITVLEHLVAHHFTANRHGPCVQAATRLLVLEPLREDIHRALMRCHAAQGRFNLALKQYDHCRAILQQQLRVQPASETRALYEELRRGRMGPAGAADASPGRETPARPDPSPPIPIQALGPRGLERPPVRPPTHYVKSAGANIAYQVTGDGPLDMVYVQGWVSNLDYAWESPRLAHVLRRLGSFCRLIRIDKRGTGLSDRNVGLSTLEARMEDVRAVLDAVGSRRTVLFGSSEGGLMCMLFATSYPERTAALVLHGAYARGHWSRDYPWGRTRQELEDELAAIEREWGKPADLARAAPSLMNDAYEREWFAAYLRNSASPADAISLWRWGVDLAVEDILHAIHVPTLIVQRRGDRWIKVEEARYLARRIRGATYVELPGDDHLIWGADSDRLVDTIEEFLATPAPPAAEESVLLAIMHAEVSSAPATTGRNGALPPGALQACHDEAAHTLRRAEGREIARTENGFIAVFQRPTRAIRCAMEFRDRMMEIGLVARAAVHIGECQQKGGEFEGMAIHVTSALLGHAEPGAVVASRTVRDLVVGSDLTFQPCGEADYAEAHGSWCLFSISEPAVQSAN